MIKGRQTVRTTSALLIAGLAIVALHTSGRLIRTDWMLWLLWLLPVAALTGRLVREADRPLGARCSGTAPVLAAFAMLLVYVFSSGVRHSWTYYVNWDLPAQSARWLEAGVVQFVLLTALLWPLLTTTDVRTKRILWWGLIGAQLACLAMLWAVTGGAALYRDDHPSFMFRLRELSRTFPQLVNYSPFWNGGGVGYVESASGTTSLGLFLWPLWRLFPVHCVYTPAIAFLFIILVPLLAAVSMRLMGIRGPAPVCAALLALGVSQHFFLWLLHFGTVGSSFAMCFLLPFTALVFRTVWLNRTGFLHGVGIVVTGFFLLQWPPCVIAAAPLAISMLASRRRWSTTKIRFLAVSGLVLLGLYSRTIILFVTQGSSHMAYVMKCDATDEKTALLDAVALSAGWQHLAAHLREIHPVILFLGLVGIAAVPFRSLRRWFLPPVICLALVTGWGNQLLPKLQLSRMAIPLALAGVLPAAAAAGMILRRRRARAVFPCAALTALLLLGGLNVARLYGNQGPAPYGTMTGRLQRMVAWIKDNTDPGSRILFAGSCVHTYGGGHTAYLPVLTEREMVSCDYYAFPPDKTEYNMPPRDFRGSPHDIFRYLELYNVGHVITRHGVWIRHFEAEPERYERSAVFRDMNVFRVLRDPSMFLEGGGTIRSDFNRIDVRLDADYDRVVLCYNWVDGFTPPDGVELFAFEAEHGVRLLGIRPNGARNISLLYRRWL